MKCEAPRLPEFTNTAALHQHYAGVRKRLEANAVPDPESWVARPAAKLTPAEAPIVVPVVTKPEPVPADCAFVLAALIGGQVISGPGLPQVEKIIRATCKVYGVARVDVLSRRRTENIVRPRQVAMYLAKTLTFKSFPDIGRRMGGRDHTTVLHGVRKISNLLASGIEPELNERVAEVRKLCGFPDDKPAEVAS